MAASDSFPTPTPEEERQLRIMMLKWDAYTALQRAICTAMMRGCSTPEDVGSYLGVTVEDVSKSLRGLWGVLYDSAHNQLFFK